MLTKEDNELITSVVPGSAMGNLLRQYWIPSMMSTELPSPDCPPVRIRILGENLIAFRVTSGKVGVIANACPHRGASMFFGRNEEEGLRCVYHGWKFDTEGNCIDMPSEPPESNFKSKVKATPYPTIERSGLIWIYMGPRSKPPELPSLIANMQPEGQYHIGCYSSECNWLQSLEGDFDTIHVGFLHAGSIRVEDMDPSDPSLNYYSRKTRWARFVVEDTEIGCTSGCNRPAEEDSTYWRIAQYLYPFYAMVPTSFSSWGFIAVVPIDDENCIRFSVSRRDGTTRPEPSDPTSYATGPSNNTTDWLGRFRLAGNRRNDYLLDRTVQKANVGPNGFSGIPGRGQDGAVTESMGIIYRRDNEHLGVTDSGIIRMRRLLIKHARALQDKGTLPPGVDQPELYRIRSMVTLLPNGVSGIEATRELQWGGAPVEEPSKLG